jgi:ribonuclease D
MPAHPRAPRETIDPAEARAREGRLRDWRTTTAAAKGVPLSQVITNKALRGLARTRVGNLQELDAIAGIGPVTCANYGAQLLALLGDPVAPPPPRIVPRAARLPLPTPNWAAPAGWRDALAAALAGVKTRERVALNLYYGLTLGRPATLAEIATILGVSEAQARLHLRTGWRRICHHAHHPPATHPHPEACRQVVQALELNTNHG